MAITGSFWLSFIETIGLSIAQPLQNRQHAQTPYANVCQIWQEIVDPRSIRLHANFHLNRFIISPFRDEKPQFWANVDIWGAPAPSALYDQSQIWYASADSPSSLRLGSVPNFVSIGLFCCTLAAESHKFCRFWTSTSCHPLWTACWAVPCRFARQYVNV